MSTPLPTSASSVRANIWQRIFYKLSGGPPNQEKLEKLKKKPWFFQYNTTLVTLFASFALIIAPEIATYLNRLPDLGSIQTLQIRILRTSLTNPHLLVELPNRAIRGMEWPIPISFRSGHRSYILSADERERLPGCQATVRAAPLRWAITDRFRIWELDCPEEGIHIGMDKTIRASLSWIETGNYVAWFIFPIVYLFCLVIYFRERRGNI